MQPYDRGFDFLVGNLGLKEYRDEKSSGKLTSHEELKREMGL